MYSKSIKAGETEVNTNNTAPGYSVFRTRLSSPLLIPGWTA